MARTAHSKQIGSHVDSKADVVHPTAGRYDRERVARLAYSYWEARGFQGGSADEDWYRAERELAHKQADEPASSVDVSRGRRLAVAAGSR